MDLIELHSSALKGYTWMPIEKRMYILFSGGNYYEYFDVPREIFIGLLNTSNVGDYFAQEIRDQFGYRRI